MQASISGLSESARRNHLQDHHLDRVDVRSMIDLLQTALRDQQLDVGVRCAVQNGQLIVVGHHRNDVVLEPVQVLRSLQQLIQRHHPDVISRVRLYLRKVGNSTPYARCHFALHPADLALVPGASQSRAMRPDPSRLLAPSAEIVSGRAVSGGAVSGGAIAPFGTATERVPSSFSQLTPGMAADTVTVSSQDVTSRPAVRVWVGDAKSDRPAWSDNLGEKLAITGGLTVVGLALGGYSVVQPCVFDSCPELGQAEVLERESQHLLQTATSQQDLAIANSYLQSAVGLLEAIPRWSGRSPEAQAALHRLNQQSDLLNAALSAADMARTAQQQSRVPLYDANSWHTVRSLWRSAIQHLEGIPETSSIHGFAQERLTEYRAALTQVEQQMQAEAQSRQLLQIAKQELQIAQQQNTQATSPEEWQFTLSAWQVAVDRLQQIPQDTVAGLEARRLLVAYGDRPQQVSDRLQALIARQQLDEAEANLQDATASQAFDPLDSAVSDVLAAHLQIPPAPRLLTNF
ncbi:MAG: hypothetical protein KME20_04085 [Kaiparowitsia implicata GSE-PSE-MK54-09C]|jgi:hypothetical protein|nr:hypothetical protein [Kaiparowitsia implicata GSE-PSE-MK54-09C]